MRYLLDTNICIYIVNNRPEGVRKRFAFAAVGDVGMSVITYGELTWGAEASSKARENLQRLRAFARIVTPLDLPSLPKIGAPAVPGADKGGATPAAPAEKGAAAPAAPLPAAGTPAATTAPAAPAPAEKAAPPPPKSQ